MQKFKIKEILQPKNDKSPTILKDEAGTTISGFDAKLKDLTPGTDIEVEIVVKGTYNNIKSWSLVTLAPGPGGTPPAMDEAALKMRISAQNMRTALAQACRLAASGKITLEELDQYIERFNNLLTKGLPKPGRVSKAPASAPAGSVDEDWGNMGRQGARDSGTITSIGQLFTVCLEDFKLTATQVVSELGHAKKEDITLPWPECYEIIAARLVAVFVGLEIKE